MNATRKTRHLRAWMTLAALVLQIAGVGGAALAASPSGSLSVTTDHSSYAAGASVAISGTVTVATAAVGLEVDGPSGNVWVGQPIPNAQGAFSDSFTLSASAPAGTYTVYATANVPGGTLRATSTFTVTSQAPPTPGALTIQTTSLPSGTAGTSYGPVTLTATGGQPSYTWSVSPALPAGLQLTTLADGDGQISGTPTGSSTTSLTFQVKDATGATAQRTIQLIVGASAPGALTIQTTSLPSGTAGTSYGPVTLTATGGQPSYTWSVSPALPAGLQLTTLADGDGQISGTPTGSSATILTFQVKDATGTTATQMMELVVAPTGVNVNGPNLNSDSATLGSLTVTGNSGSGSIGLAGYSGNPGGTITFNESGLYFNIALSPGNTFQTLTLNDCALPTVSPSLYWWNTSATPPAWQSVQPLSSPAESVTPDPNHPGDYCLTLTLASGSQPNLADLLTGTAFAVSLPAGGGGGGGGGGGFAPSGGTGGSAFPVSASVGSSGGTLTTSDGLCSMTVPAGAIPSGSTLTISESSSVPTNLPSGLVVLSPVCTFSGASLTPPQPVTMTFDPTNLKGLSTQRASIYAETSGAWTFAPTAIAAKADTATAYVGGPESVIVLGNIQQFSDVPAGFWAKGDIDALLAGLVVGGFPNGTFQPNGDLTRAQFVKMLVLALGLKPSTAPTPFTDVPSGAWYATYVSAAVQAGIINGVSPTRFDPNGPLTREQMAVVLARALKLTKTATLHFTDDAAIATWALKGVEEAVAAGYINGFPNGSFQPLGTTTRAQAAKVLATALRNMAP